MRRRHFLLCLSAGVAAWPLSSANAQARVRRIVFLASTPSAEIFWICWEPSARPSASTAEAATGFQSRRGRCHEPTPVTPHYAPFPTYKKAGGPVSAERRSSCLAARRSRAAADQDPARRILGNSTAALEANLVDPFRDALRGLGYVEGQNVLIDYRWADGSYEHFPALIADLIAREVDVIVTAGTPAALAVAKATTSIPV